MNLPEISVSTQAFACTALLMLSCLACKHHGSVVKNSTVPDPALEKDVKGMWMRLVSANSDSLAFLYTPEAVHINETGQVTSGAATIAELVKNGHEIIDGIATRYEVPATPDSTYIYELGTYTTTKDQTFKNLIIWNTKGGQKLRELEFVSRADMDAKVDAGITERRGEWIRLCNAHNAAALVSEVYAENAIYYNHRPVIVGREGIHADYQYMNDSNYRLSLEPILLEAVTDDLVFEIGQCSGTYKGKYILIWQKNTEGIWHILLDSNI